MREVRRHMEHFRPRQRLNYSTLPFVSRPSNRETFVVFGSGNDGFEVFVHRDVRNVIAANATKAVPNETVGLLAGRVLRDEYGPYTLVLAAEGARSDEIDASPSRVRISANGQAQVRSRLETTAYGLDVIGWYHSHPKFLARFSGEDFTEQSGWRDPNNVGIVVSGLDPDWSFGVYRGPQALLLEARAIPPSPSAGYVTALVDAHSVPTTIRADRPNVAQSEHQPETARARKTWSINRTTLTRLFPLVLWLIVFASLVSIFRIDNRVSSLESTLHLMRSTDRPADLGPSPAISPPATSPDEIPSPVNINPAPISDPVDRRATKPLVLHSPNPNIKRRGHAFYRKRKMHPSSVPVGSSKH